jgi:excisionase family DNA binding protein
MNNVISLVPRQGTPAAQAADDDRAVYTVPEVARLLSLSRGSAYALVREGTIPALRMGGRWIIPKRRFHAWLDGLTEEGRR